MNVLLPETPRRLLFPKGTIIWRPVPLVEIEWEKTPKGSYLTRCLLNGNFIHEPEVNEKGSVVFIDRLPVENWTHLVVTGVSKAMHVSPDPKGKGQAIFAIPGIPFDMDNYLAFRGEIKEMILLHPEASYDIKVDYSFAAWPVDRRAGDRRLIYDNTTSQYEHIYCGEEEYVGEVASVVEQLPGDGNAIAGAEQ